MNEFACLLLGYLAHNGMIAFNMYTLQAGVDYYGEVHRSGWNCLIHTLFMPLTMMGMFLWIPALFKMTPHRAFQLRKEVSFIYIGHYLRIRLVPTMFVIGLYSMPYAYSHIWYTRWYYYKEPIFLRGFLLSFAALFIQEVIGHYIGGDDPSRIEGIPNAIVYAPYFSVSHFYQ